jgi:hypothetical protein
MIQRGNGRSRPTPAAVNRLPAERTSVPGVELWRTRVEAWIAEHPVASIAAALTLGATLGWLIKRR